MKILIPLKEGRDRQEEQSCSMRKVSKCLRKPSTVWQKQASWTAVSHPVDIKDIQGCRRYVLSASCLSFWALHTTGLTEYHSVIIEWGILIIDFWNIPGIYLKLLADLKLSVIFSICSESLNNVPQIIQLINISMETSSSWRNFVKTKYFQCVHVLQDPEIKEWSQEQGYWEVHLSFWLMTFHSTTW